MFHRQASPSDEEGTSLPSTAAGVPVASAELQSRTGDYRVSSDPRWSGQDWDVNSVVNDPVRASCDPPLGCRVQKGGACCVSVAAVPFKLRLKSVRTITDDNTTFNHRKLKLSVNKCVNNFNIFSLCDYLVLPLFTQSYSPVFTLAASQPRLFIE